MRYFEDIDVGETHTTGEYAVTAEEITEIGERFDPQPFHVDEAAARDSLFGGLAASGVHTVGICQRLAVESFHLDTAVAGGAGIDDPRFPRPVYAGDVLSARLEVTDKRPLGSYPDMGIVDLEQVVTNGDDEVVLEMTTLPIIRRRRGPDDAD